jgi:hypothetical protein
VKDHGLLLRNKDHHRKRRRRDPDGERSQGTHTQKLGVTSFLTQKDVREDFTGEIFASPEEASKKEKK